jgi:hypothetical protein
MNIPVEQREPFLNKTRLGDLKREEVKLPPCKADPSRSDECTNYPTEFLIRDNASGKNLYDLRHVGATLRYLFNENGYLDTNPTLREFAAYMKTLKEDPNNEDIRETFEFAEYIERLLRGESASLTDVGKYPLYVMFLMMNADDGDLTPTPISQQRGEDLIKWGAEGQGQGQQSGYPIAGQGQQSGYPIAGQGQGPV